MFLSRNDFDPVQYHDVYREDIERINAKQETAERVSQQAAHARYQALAIIQRTNDLSDTLRRMRQ
jgi:non-homologous end joining protein Ku